MAESHDERIGPREDDGNRPLMLLTSVALVRRLRENPTARLICGQENGSLISPYVVESDERGDHVIPDQCPGACEEVIRMGLVRETHRDELEGGFLVHFQYAHHTPWNRDASAPGSAPESIKRRKANKPMPRTKSKPANAPIATSTEKALTYAEAAEDLGVQKKDISAAVKEGDLTKTGRARGSRIIVDEKYVAYQSGVVTQEDVDREGKAWEEQKKTILDKRIPEPKTPNPDNDVPVKSKYDTSPTTAAPSLAEGPGYEIKEEPIEELIAQREEASLEEEVFPESAEPAHAIVGAAVRHIRERATGEILHKMEWGGTAVMPKEPDPLPMPHFEAASPSAEETIPQRSFFADRWAIDEYAGGMFPFMVKRRKWWSPFWTNCSTHCTYQEAIADIVRSIKCTTIVSREVV